MTEKIWFRTIIGLLIALYPALIYFGLSYFHPRWLALIIVTTAAIRLIGRQAPSRSSLGMAFAVLAATGITLLSGDELGLLLYPVIMNTILFLLFTYSLLNPPSIIETIARSKDAEFPPEAVGYTRNVTIVWSAFFLINGSAAAITISLSREIWALYNGLISYLLMGMLFLGEWLVRKRVRRVRHD